MLLTVVLTAYCAQDEYTIVRIGSQTTIYSTFTSGNYTGISELKGDNLTIENLENFGLPKGLWGQVSGTNGVYDTRLVNAETQNSEYVQLISQQTDEIYDLRATVRYRSFVLIASIVTMIIVFSVAYHNKR